MKSTVILAAIALLGYKIVHGEQPDVSTSRATHIIKLRSTMNISTGWYNI